VDDDHELTLGAAGSFNPLVSFPPSELQGAGMTAARLPMRQIREVLRLRYSSRLSQRGIALSLGMSQGAVSNYLAAARRAGRTWPLCPELDDDIKLETLLFLPHHRMCPLVHRMPRARLGSRRGAKARPLIGLE
jgi:hypothetical protein